MRIGFDIDGLSRDTVGPFRNLLRALWRYQLDCPVGEEVEVFLFSQLPSKPEALARAKELGLDFLPPYRLYVAADTRVLAFRLQVNLFVDDQLRMVVATPCS